jgi:phosphoglycolate phosphatase
MIQLAVFDLDGTLVDTPTAIVDGLTATFTSLGVVAPEPAAIRATIGRPLDQAIADLVGLPAGSELVGAVMRGYQRLFLDQIVPRARELIHPGVADGLATLARHGLTLAIATSKFTASANAMLVSAGLRDRFDLVVGADQVSRPKPDPETGYLILRTLGMPPGSAVMVGDTTHDISMAVSADVRSIAVTYGVHTVDELKAANPTWLADTFDAAVEHILRTA